MRFIIVFVLIVFSCSGELFCQKIVSLKFNYVDKEIETPYRVSCESYEFSFSKDYSKKIIKNKAIIERFKNAFKTVAYSKVQKKIDVRIKLYVNYKDRSKQTIICSDRFNNIMINGKLILPNNKLVEFININLPANHRI